MYAGEIGTLADPTHVWSLLVTVRPWRSRLAVDKTDTAVMTKPTGAGRRDAVRDGSPAAALVNAAHKVIDARKVQTIFQPLVHLATNEVVGYEALTRGPQGSLVELPLDLLSAARAAGRLAELDWMCAAAACEAALGAGLHPSMSIFLNLEPSTLLTPCPPDLLKSTRRAQNRLRIVVEMKEDSLMADPGPFFDALIQVREIGWGVAIDNAGASAASLALLPLSRPDVLKLDLRGLRDDLATLAEMGDAARLYAEQTGATVLAQGLETPDDILLARAVGATFGQGYYFGRPEPLPKDHTVPRSVFPLLPAPRTSAGATPFEIISEKHATAITQKRYLEPLSTYLEDQTGSGSAVLLLVSFQRDMTISERALARLHDLIDRSAFTVAFGPGLAALDWPRSRTGSVSADDRLSTEWNVLVLSARYAGAVVARDLGERGVDQYRQFEYVVTHDRELILQAAHGFLRRVKPALRHPGTEAGL
jgi:EAL domain-containing protein (putative c-di-GMP-specific phosphodiesterase class I)